MFYKLGFYNFVTVALLLFVYLKEQNSYIFIQTSSPFSGTSDNLPRESFLPFWTLPALLPAVSAHQIRPASRLADGRISLLSPSPRLFLLPASAGYFPAQSLRHRTTAAVRYPAIKVPVRSLSTLESKSGMSSTIRFTWRSFVRFRHCSSISS